MSVSTVPLSQRIPSLTCNVAQACFHCSDNETPELTLKKCSGCKRVAYCSAQCQKDNWKQHKKFCTAFSQLEKEKFVNPNSALVQESLPSNDQALLESLASSTRVQELKAMELLLKRELTLPERNLLLMQPRCIVCTRTERAIRMQDPLAEVPKTEQEAFSVPALMFPCSDCRLSFFCCKGHYEFALVTHKAPSFDSAFTGTKSVCEINWDITTTQRLSNSLTKSGSDRPFSWAPERTMEIWKSLEGTSWEEEFEDLMRKEVQVPESVSMKPWLRAASEPLSFPMTILYGLEKLYGADDSWTKKDILSIHIIGASQTEVINASMFEEVLHRLPKVRQLKLTLCGPELAQMISNFKLEASQPMEMDTCPNCTRLRRKRLHYHISAKYHDFVASQPGSFSKPDLAIAFNSGMSEGGAQEEGWKQTLDVLVKRRIPTLFTAYNQEEAEQVAELLKKAGAKLLDSLGPSRNPWGSISLIKDPGKLQAYYAVNGWIAGGFYSPE